MTIRAVLLQSRGSNYVHSGPLKSALPVTCMFLHVMSRVHSTCRCTARRGAMYVVSNKNIVLLPFLARVFACHVGPVSLATCRSTRNAIFGRPRNISIEAILLAVDWRELAILATLRTITLFTRKFYNILSLYIVNRLLPPSTSHRLSFSTLPN